MIVSGVSTIEFRKHVPEMLDNTCIGCFLDCQRTVNGQWSTINVQLTIDNWSLTIDRYCFHFSSPSHPPVNPAFFNPSAHDIHPACGMTGVSRAFPTLLRRSPSDITPLLHHSRHRESKSSETLRSAQGLEASITTRLPLFFIE